jgi:tRNA pseudouridine55 synthase
VARGNRADLRPVSGIVLVDKPAGLTSNRVLQQTRRLFRAQKAGHTGTLDPPATGMLPVCLGAATRVSGLMLDASKRYRVTAEFGAATDTGDAAGEVMERRETSELPLQVVSAAVATFQGRILQTPPMFSAIKVGGRRMYELARQGGIVEREPRPVQIFEILVEEMSWPRLTLLVHCSKGTYIRSLVSDIALSLGTLAHVHSLRRTSVGPFHEPQMLTLESLQQAADEGLDSLDRHLLPIDSALQDRPTVRVSADEAGALRQGRRLSVPAAVAAPLVRIYDPFGTLVGLGEITDAGELGAFCIFPA